MVFQARERLVVVVASILLFRTTVLRLFVISISVVPTVSPLYKHWNVLLRARDQILNDWCVAAVAPPCLFAPSYVDADHFSGPLQ